MKTGTGRLVGLVALIAFAGSARAAVVETSRTDFFERKIRPILMDNCYKCHSPSAPKLKGGLNVASREGLLKGGENGAAIVPGHPEKSKLIEAINWKNKDLQMPPKTQLSEAAIADLTKWVQMGAPWGGGMLKGPVGPNYDKLRQTHWAWQAVRPVAVPSVRNTAWPLGDVDKFVLANMERQGLHPVGQANKYELLRRVTYDLTGLPATPQEIDAFVADQSPDAYTKVVDRLLASPAFGERWGRHWLDVARYAESTGSSRNYEYEYAWRYRNYVIDSFANDKPFNQFIMEQVAGDLLPFHSAKQHNEQLVATGYLALGVKDLNEKDKLKYTMDNVDEQIDVVGKSILGLTVSCARCHDHKFDPIPQADYYKLAGIFKSTEIMCGLTARKGAAKKQPENDALMLRLDPVVGGDSSANAQLAQQLESKLRQDQSELQSDGGGKAGKKAKKLAGNSVAAKKQRQEIEALRQDIENTRTQLQALQQGSALAIGVKDAAPGNSPIFEHGDVENPGPQVPRGMISLCRFVYTTPISSNQSGRLELARWMASRENPLTTRVVTNRIWHYLFGEGIVRTVDNFGTTGEAPINQPLLDYLATRFATTDNWSFKKMIRELVLTRTYQMAGTWDAVNGATDPGDRYLWRMEPRRLEAEEIRDSILLASGSLNFTRPAGSTSTEKAGRAELRKYASANNTDSFNYRSVYLPVVRDRLPPALDHFDFANPEMVTGDREVTTVAPQALYLMNDPFVLNHSEQIAGKLLDNDWMDQSAKIDLAYKLTYGRPATPAEKQRAAAYLSSYGSSPESKKDRASDAWASLCQALLASAEFRYLN